jgi:hypothetical protein
MDHQAIVVMDPANGPGTHADPNYVAAIELVRNAGHDVYGYVDTAYGTRPLPTMLAEAGRYRDWYGVVGVLLDQTTSDHYHVGYYRSLADGLRRRGFRLALNPGQPDLHRGYVELADEVIVFEGTYSQYEHQRFPSWMRAVKPTRLWHLVYDVPSGALMEEVTSLAVERNASVLLVTDRHMPNPWDGVPTYWAEECRTVGLHARSR